MFEIGDRASVRHLLQRIEERGTVAVQYAKRAPRDHGIAGSVSGRQLPVSGSACRSSTRVRMRNYLSITSGYLNIQVFTLENFRKYPNK
jgi:hypothetical protein